MRNSVAGYGNHTPNYWKVAAYGGPENCNEANQFCYVCEPKSENTSLTASFSVFPEPSKAPTWQAATQYIEKWAGSQPTPQWHPEILPGSSYTDPTSGISSIVPGDAAFAAKGSDPYVDLVQLALDLGCSGVDIDYEEMWHADSFKTGEATGPWTLHQTSYKYAAILKDVGTAIATIAPGMLFTTAAGAVGAWSTPWWGGNLKGVWYEVNTRFPSVMSPLLKSGGINVMTYDLSDNQDFHECPDDEHCTLSQQVAFYMGTYSKAGIGANVGYEVGTPAYPAPDHDKAHQLPLTTSALSSIVSTSQSQAAGGFLWQIFKPNAAGEASSTDVAQAICKSVMPQSKRCTGTFPTLEH
jgi:hypothetical protein